MLYLTLIALTQSAILSLSAYSAWHLSRSGSAPGIDADQDDDDALFQAKLLTHPYARHLRYDVPL